MDETCATHNWTTDTQEAFVSNLGNYLKSQPWNHTKLQERIDLQKN